MERLRIGSFFSGIGAFEKALERLEIPHETVFYCEIDKYASKAYSLIHNVPESFNLWDITKVDETELPEFDLMTWGFPCFPAGTLVMTSDGYKEIQDVKQGDEVLTHKNRFQKVVKTMQKHCPGLYRVKAYGVEQFEVTAEHPFYVRKMYRQWDNENRVYKRLFGEPEWVEAKDLDKGCYVGVAINQKSELPTWNGYEYKHQGKIVKSKNELDFSNPDLWWLIGRYIGDGWTRIAERKSRPNSPNYRTIICCAKSELSDITSRLDGLFSYSVAEERTVYKIHIVNKELTMYLQQFGQGACNKRLVSDVFNLPVNLLECFLDGYFGADGCYSQGLYKATSVSRELMYGIQSCIHKVYHRPCSLHKSNRPKTSIIDGRTIKQKDTYSIAFKKENNKQDEAFCEDGYIWVPFRSKEIAEYNDYVFNFEVAKDNSYTTFNLIVHNCQDISVAGKQAGIVEGETRSGLYYDGLRILKHKMPKYSIIENVKNLTSEKFRPIFHQILCDLEDAGYHSYYEVLNAKDYGIPQNRERIFIVSIRKDVDQGFVFPLPFDNGLRLKDLLEDEVDEKYYISQEKTEKLLSKLKENQKVNEYTVFDSKNAFGGCKVFDDIAPTLLTNDFKEPKKIVFPVLTPDRQEKRQNGRRFKDDGEPMFTLTGQDRHGILINRGQLKCKDDDICSCIDASYYKGIDNRAARIGILQIGNIDQEKRARDNPQTGRVYDPAGISPCLNTMQGGNLEPKILIDEPTVFKERKDEGMRFFQDGVCGTLRTISECGDKRVIYPNYRIRKLTPLECFRLMDFDDADWQTLVDNGISDSQLYKMAGNSIVVQVLEVILGNLLKSGAEVPGYFYGEQMSLFG